MEYSDEAQEEEEEEEEEDYIVDAHDFNHDKDEFTFDEKLPQLLQYLDWQDCSQLINNIDSIDLKSEQFRERILSMRYQLIKENDVLRTSYKGYSLHMFRIKDFQRLSWDYIKQNSIYTLIKKINTTKPTVSQQCLMKIVEQVETTLDDLFCSDVITQRQYDQMRVSRFEAELHYLIFALDMKTNKKNETFYLVRPIMICNNGATMRISHYLSNLLWSIFHQQTGCKTFTNGAQLVQTFELYSKNQYLQSTTLFITFNIHEMCTKFSHEVMIKALEHFLLTYATQEKMEGLAIETILQLVRLVLDNQYFIYRNKLYQQTKGNASGCRLTIPLTCIYLCYTQPTLMSALIDQNHIELFGKFQHDLFFTWNKSEDQVRYLFEKSITIENQYRSISIHPSIGTTFHLLDIEIGHHDGTLHTRIFHDPVMDQYELPNQFEYGTCLPSRLLQAILMHAVRCCSNEDSFHFEQRYIKFLYLLYGFSVDFIDDSIQRFYKQFHASEIHYLVDRIPYEILRQRVLIHYEPLLVLKKRWYTEIENIQPIPYSNYHSDPSMMDYFKCHLFDLLKKCFIFEPEFNENEIEMKPHLMKNIPLPMMKYFEKQKPSRHLLTLPIEESDQYDSMCIDR
ncbi:unnamed protein product [Rotaria sp. Silwood2]|nr:unnamed protein product [Rotaria sp. Silwood2]